MAAAAEPYGATLDNGRATMDDIERKLIALLRKDARTPIATRATKLGVSRGTIGNTNGRWDLLAELSQVLERVRRTKGIANTETSILLATFR